MANRSSMDTPLISVVIPAYNAEAYLAEAIQSVIEQTYSPIEIVVVDDGSTDSTAEIAKGFQDVRYLRQPQSGPGVARNRGISESRGEYIGFHDADDVCLPNRFEEQMACLLQQPSLGYVLTRIQNFLEPGKNVPEHMRTPELMLPRMGFISSGLMKRATFETVGLFNDQYRIGEDVDWLMRADRARVAVVVLIEVLIRRRLHDSNISVDVTLGHKNLLSMIRKSLKPPKGLSD